MTRSWRSQIADEVRASSRMTPKWPDDAMKRIAEVVAERDAALAEVARLSTPPDDAEVAELVAELATKSAMIQLGEKIAWGSETALMDKAADAITRMSHALRREREPVEPVAWKAVYTDILGKAGQPLLIEDKDEAEMMRSVSGWAVTPLHTTPPDALALVAAAYRDAAGLPAFDCTGDPCGTFDGKVFVKLDAILTRTPADAEAHLTALLRAEYERGKAEAQVQGDTFYILEWMAGARPPVHPNPMRGRQSFRTPKEAIAFFKRQASDAQFLSLTKRVFLTEDCTPQALALLTQEGR